MSYTKEQVAKQLKDAVEWLKEQDAGCVTIKLDDRLGICVGWLAGYGEEVRDDCIQSKEEPDFAINAGIKVYTSDDMRTDYEFINMPYYENGEVLATDVSVEPDEDFTELAEYLLDEYDSMKDLNIEEDGLIVVENEPEVEVSSEDTEHKELPSDNTHEEESLKEELSQEELKNLGYELEDHFSKLGVFYEIWPCDNNSLCVEISWGDWKHDHLWCDYEVKNFLKSKGHEVVSYDTQVTEEDGSDTYSAIHSYIIK